VDIIFSNKDITEDKQAKSGDIVKIIITDTIDKRPFDYTVCFAEDYQDMFKKLGFILVNTYKSLAEESDHYKWVNEIKIAPWTIYIPRKP
jgi:hypothetical protein